MISIALFSNGGSFWNIDGFTLLMNLNIYVYVIIMSVHFECDVNRVSPYKTSFVSSIYFSNVTILFTSAYNKVLDPVTKC